MQYTSALQVSAQQYSGFPIMGGGGHAPPHPMIFFEPPPIKTDAPLGCTPHLKMKPPIRKTNSLIEA